MMANSRLRFGQSRRPPGLRARLSIPVQQFLLTYVMNICLRFEYIYIYVAYVCMYIYIYTQSHTYYIMLPSVNTVYNLHIYCTAQIPSKVLVPVEPQFASIGGVISERTPDTQNPLGQVGAPEMASGLIMFDLFEKASLAPNWDELPGVLFPCPIPFRRKMAQSVAMWHGFQPSRITWTAALKNSCNLPIEPSPCVKWPTLYRWFGWVGAPLLWHARTYSPYYIYVNQMVY